MKPPRNRPLAPSTTPRREVTPTPAPKPPKWRGLAATEPAPDAVACPGCTFLLVPAKFGEALRYPVHHRRGVAQAAQCPLSGSTFDPAELEAIRARTPEVQLKEAERERADLRKRIARAMTHVAEVERHFKECTEMGHLQHGKALCRDCTKYARASLVDVRQALEGGYHLP